MTTERIVAALRAQAQQLQTEGVEHLALFGSRARGDAGSDSDLDVLIDIYPGRRFSLLDYSGVCLAIEDAVGIPSQVVLRRSLDPQIAGRIRDDVIEVF